MIYITERRSLFRKCSDEERLFDNTDATFDPDQAVAEIVPSLVLLDENDDEVVGIKPQIDVEKHLDDHRVTSISAKPHLKSNTDDQGTNNNQSQQHTGRLSSDKDSEASSRTVANNWSSGSKKGLLLPITIGLYSNGYLL